MFSFFKAAQYYYAIILFSLFLLLTSALYFLWFYTPVDINRTVAIVEASQQVDHLKNTPQLHHIKRLANTDQVRESLREFRHWNEQVTNIQRIAGVQNFQRLNNDKTLTRQNMEQLVGLPEASNIIAVLSRKVNDFEAFVIRNNWRTLTRISGRVKARLEYSPNQRDIFYGLNSLTRLHQEVTADLERMQSVTENSVLSQDNKNRILARISEMSPELDMIYRYVEHLENLNAQLDSTTESFALWSSAASPELTSMLERIEKSGQYTFFAVFVLALFSFTSFIAGIFIYKSTYKKTKRKVEEISIQILRDGLIPLNNSLPNQFSKEFYYELEKYREYIHKRMSFGSVFQEAMPFSTIMLDNNLNIAWANALFYKIWGLKETGPKEDPLSWDYLQQFTNLGEDDPVLMALNEGIAGIYQIQIKNYEDSEGLPYEMYVSPVDYAGQSRIMIFFYPLRSLEESISHQVRSIVGPVGRTLDILACEEDLVGEEALRLKKDFEIAGIEHLYEKFCSYNEVVKSQKERLSHQVNDLCHQLESKESLIVDANQLSMMQRDLLNSAVNEFEKTRDMIILNGQARDELYDCYKENFSQAQDLALNYQALADNCLALKDSFEQSYKTYEKLSSVTKLVKEKKESLIAQKTHLSQTLEKMMVSRKREGQSTSSMNSSEIKSELRQFDQKAEELVKVITSMDIVISHLEMMMEDVKTPDLDFVISKQQEFLNFIESEKFQQIRQESICHESDERIVKVLKDFYQVFMSLKRSFNYDERSSREYLQQEKGIFEQNA